MVSAFKMLQQNSSNFLAQMYMNYLVLDNCPSYGTYRSAYYRTLQRQNVGNSEEENLSFSRCLLASIGLILMPQAEIFIAFYLPYGLVPEC
jgi:hypothetical protein